MNVLVSIQHPVAQWQIPASAVAMLRARFPQVEFVHATTPAARAQGLIDCDAVYTWILSAAELATAPRLKWLHTSAVALETLCLPELFARGARVSNTRGVQAVPIAEHVLAMVLACAKQIPFTLENQRSARWAQADYIDDRLPWLLQGRTLGLIGVGTIGSAIAERAAAFGMRVVAMRRRLEIGTHAGAETVGPESLPYLLAQSDVLVIAAPLTAQTSNLIGAAELMQLKRGSVVVNVGRAKILDTDALIAALRSGHLGGASLDVFPQEPLPADHPLWSCPNLILTPHTSGFRQGHWDEVAMLFADNLHRWLHGDALRFEVDAELGY